MRWFKIIFTNFFNKIICRFKRNYAEILHIFECYENFGKILYKIYIEFLLVENYIHFSYPKCGRLVTGSEIDKFEEDDEKCGTRRFKQCVTHLRPVYDPFITHPVIYQKPVCNDPYVTHL